jgi:hypothetical protein
MHCSCGVNSLRTGAFLWCTTSTTPTHNTSSQQARSDRIPHGTCVDRRRPSALDDPSLTTIVKGVNWVCFHWMPVDHHRPPALGLPLWRGWTHPDFHWTPVDHHRPPASGLPLWMGWTCPDFYWMPVDHHRPPASRLPLWMGWTRPDFHWTPLWITHTSHVGWYLSKALLLL